MVQPIMTGDGALPLPSTCIYKTCFAAYSESLHLMRNGQPHIAQDNLLRAKHQLREHTRSDNSTKMLLVMISVRLSECSLRMHNPADALELANSLLARTAFLGEAYSTARHILHVVKALACLELGLTFNAVIDTHNLVQTAPEHRRQSCMQFARRMACKVALGNAGQTDVSTESCCSNARKRTRPAVSEAPATTCSSAHEDDMQDTAVSMERASKRHLA